LISIEIIDRNLCRHSKISLHAFGQVRFLILALTTNVSDHHLFHVSSNLPKHESHVVQVGKYLLGTHQLEIALINVPEAVCVVVTTAVVPGFSIYHVRYSNSGGNISS
jgi:hypothetical protein